MKISLSLLLLTGSMLVSGQSVQEPAVADYFTNNGLGAAVKTMQHPAGVHYQGVTYVTYQGPTEDPYIAAYNHTTGTWEGPFKAGESVLTGREPGTIDNHGKPCMIIDDEGYIHLVFGGHGGDPTLGANPLGNAHRGQMKHMVSKKPLDISEWEELNNISPFGTYNQFVKMDNGDLYLFYRHGAHRSNWVYQLSTDNGRSFATPVSVILTKPAKDASGIQDSWYAWFENGHGNEIIATYNYHVCKEGGLHDGERHNCYYMTMDTEDKVWRNVKGEKLRIPLTKEEADAKTLVANTGDFWTVRGTVRLDVKGYPHIIYYMGEHLGLRHGGPKTVIYCRWTGEEWFTAENTGLPVATGDILVSAPERSLLLLACRKKDHAELAWWKTADGGGSFKRAEVLYKRSNTGITTTAMIKNAHPDARVIISCKHKGDFRKMYLIGDKGPVQRLKTEADQLEH